MCASFDQAGRPHPQHAHIGRRAAASKWSRIASETLDIYAPIAHRLGLNQTYRELQDLSFRYLRPWRYAVLAKAVAKGAQPTPRPDPKGAKEVETAFAAPACRFALPGAKKRCTPSTKNGQ
jgi:guanosine-3',5'-bis(diphosphate) 3'-pyrophosphohydrolase